MIIVQLSGGLGNQLFQYAFAYSRAKELGVQLKIDLSFYDDYEWHDYSLAPFNLSALAANSDEIAEIKKLDNGVLYKVKQRLLKGIKHQLVEENLLFNKKYLKIHQNSYIIGYWQSEKYFCNHWSDLMNEFRINISPSSNNLELLKEVQSEQSSISLHIRRGNYANIESVNLVHGTMPISYYEDAINFFEGEIVNPKFYVFSDDISWAKDNLKLKHPSVFVDHNDDKCDYEDLRLMANCKHHIIANSTFSWWGAYLNSNSTKIVIGPKQWFSDVDKNKEAVDIIPKNWVKL
jgi:hypothetical protein